MHPGTNTPVTILKTCLLALPVAALSWCSATEGGASSTGAQSSDLASAAGECDDAGASSDAGWFACDSATGCVAVRRITNCCSNGWKIAVARDEVEAYLRATECKPAAGHLCPEYVVDDTRVATCDLPRGTCVMVEPGSSNIELER
jgi:hypothetical protein